MPKIVGILAFLFGFLGAQSDLPPGFDATLLKGIDYVHQDRYDEALALFQKVQTDLPNHPAGFFFYGAALEWISLDYRNYEQGSIFFANMNKVVALAQTMIQKQPNNAWAYFYLGAGYGFMGLTSIKYGNWIKAFFDGMAGYKHMIKALELKPDLYDVYFGLGQFHYWRSKKSGLVRAAVGPNEMKQGIDELVLATQKGYFTVNETKNALVTIYGLEGNFSRSTKILEETMAQYPDYLFSWWAMAQNHMMQSNGMGALQALEQVERKISASSWSGPLAFVECYVMRAQAHALLGEKEQARAQLKRAWGVDQKKLRGIDRFHELMRDADKVKQKVGL